MKKSPFLLPCMTAALLLSACGGGGGDTADAPAPQTNSAITADNATKAAVNAYTAASFVGTSPETVNSMLTGVSINTGGASVLKSTLALVKRAYANRPLNLMMGISSTNNCSGGGTVSISGSVLNEATASNGDVLTITSNNCIESGDTTNGSINVTFSGISGTPFSTGAWTATMTIRFTGLENISAGETTGVSGDMKIVANQASSTNVSFAVSGTSLQLSRTVSGARLNQLTMSAYVAIENMSGNTFSDSANFTLSGTSDALGAFTYAVRSVQPFVSIGSAMPASGSSIVSGAASSVTITAVDASKVRLDYSAMGDGAITQSTTLDWTSFLAAM
jgi:hypothetical protein